MDHAKLEQLGAFLEALCATDSLEARFKVDSSDLAWSYIAQQLNGFLDKLWLREFQLSAKQEMLARVVEIRTNEVNEILDKVSSGFLIARSDETVLGNFSRSCIRIFGHDGLEGRKLSELMQLPPRERDHFAACYSQVFEDALPVELTLDQVPKDFCVSGRNYQLECAPIVDDDGHVVKLFVTINDVTELQRAEAENMQRLALLEILRQKDNFRDFLYETSRSFKEVRRQPTEPTLRSLLHTVKGNLGCYALYDLAALIHSLEEAPRLSEQDIQTVEDALRKFLEVHRDVLELEWPEAKRALRAVPASRLLPFLKDLRLAKSESEIHAEIEVFIETLAWIPAEVMLAPLRGVVQRVSERLEKDVALEISGASVLVDPERVGPVLSNVGHLVRNSLDHGIEPAHERGSKNPQGRILVMCAESRNHWFFKVSDDGRGIDDEAVVRAAVAKGTLSAADATHMSKEDRLKLVFLRGMSTKKEASLVSGRGVGTAALLDSVRDAGGGLGVFSEPGKGTTFTIRIPRHGDAALATHPDRWTSDVA